MSVTGIRHLTPAAVVGASGLIGRPAFTANTGDARAALLTLPAVRDARVRVVLADVAQVDVVEREAIGRWVSGGLEWLVDGDGVLFASADPASAPQLRATDDRDTTKACAGRVGGRCVDPAVVAAAFRLARIGPGELRADASRPEVHIDATYGLVVRSGAGWDVRFGAPDDLERKLSNAKKVLSDEPKRRLDYVDVRSADRIVFSPQ
ncbi:MAG: FtsQ-type POTRA domain-containing protein [Chloroflexota bacterium]|nr:FtsQ-type POTRA domain-containing protein [Chloroflexota bacterium]